ncbi:phospholipase D1-like [Diadema antillarum]|uniref:phospholipase D1-like n=1 Tax=Diadema antillarum TaxID=105358 RepID=UPI003A8A1BDA
MEASPPGKCLLQVHMHSPEEQAEDENDNLLRRSSFASKKNTLQVPDSRGRSNSSPVSADILTFAGSSDAVRRLSESSGRISYQTFDWDSAKLNKTQAERTRMEDVLLANLSPGCRISQGSDMSVAEAQVYVEEVKREYMDKINFSGNNSALTERRQQQFLRMTSLNGDLTLEDEVTQRQANWSMDFVDSPNQNASANANGVPYTVVYDEPVPYHDKLRRVFISDKPISIKIADCGRVHSTLHLNPNLYYIEVQHGPCVWTVHRRYNHFLRLHEELILYKARLHIPLGKSSHKERHKTFVGLPDDVNDLPHFPRTLDALVRSHQLAKRMLQLEKYLQGVANNPLYRNHPKTLEFLEVSHMSFVDEVGSKGKEGWVLKRSGGRRVQLGCFSFLSCTAKSHYSKRWLVVKDSFVAYVRPRDGHLRAVLLMDQDFRAACGRQDTGLSHGLTIRNTYRNLLVKCNHKSTAFEWMSSISQTAQMCEYTLDNPYGSFAPPREDTLVQGFADGSDYFEMIADAMEQAEQEIFILDWWLIAEIYMKRPAVEGNRWRLDCILKRKAEQGVKVFVLLYKEVEMALVLGSQHTKQTLMALHPNIQVMRHPDHIPGGAGVMLWAHHEKAVVIDQHIAFIGGIDICYGRWDDFRHKLTDTGSAFSQQGLMSKNTTEKGRETLRTKGGDEVDGGPVRNGVTLTGVERRIQEFGIQDGAPRIWMGKDYCNFVTKDVTEPEQAFQENVDRYNVPRMPWHDIAAVVHGQAALDVARHFIQRWNFTKEQKYKEFRGVPLLIPKSASSSSDAFQEMTAKATSCTCQILRSSAQWSAGMQRTEDSIHQAYIHAIQNSKHFLYIENQFFISIARDPDVTNGIADAVFERIMRAHRAGETYRVYVMMPLLPAFEGEVGTDAAGAIHAVLHWEYRAIYKGDNSLLQRLLKAGVHNPDDYISFYGLRTHDVLDGRLVTELVYIHCKLMIVDDELVILGSANINDRSMLGNRDSELAVRIEDTERVKSRMNGQKYMAGKFALQFRQQLFREHLGVLKGDGHIDVSDPVSDAFYEQTWQRIAHTNTDIFEEVFRCLPSNRVTSFLDLQKYKQEISLAQADPQEARQSLQEVRGHLVVIPLDFLCQEDLQPSIMTSEGIAPTKLWT